MNAPAQPLRIVQLTDLHLFAEAGGQMRGVNTRASFERVLAHACDGDWPPDALVLTGDLAQDEIAPTYRFLHERLRTLDTPVLCLPGNHDDPALMAQHLHGDNVSCAASHVFGDWQFVLLSSWQPGTAAGLLTDAQLAVLADTLHAAAAPHVAIWLHHPPFGIGCRWLDRLGLHNADAFWQVVRTAPVRGVFCGHVHQQFDARDHGALLTCTPSTGAQFLPGADDFALDTRPPGYRRYRFYADGRIETRVEWVDGATANAAAPGSD
jgi:Icc protein